MNCMTLEMAKQWAGSHCWLDGVPARIWREVDPEASIVDNNGRTVRMAWHQVNRVMRRDREFRA